MKQDPRGKTPALVMQEVYTSTDALYFGARDAQDAMARLAALRGRVAQLKPSAAAAVQTALAAFDARAAALQGAAECRNDIGQ